MPGLADGPQDLAAHTNMASAAPGHCDGSKVLQATQGKPHKAGLLPLLLCTSCQLPDVRSSMYLLLNLLIPDELLVDIAVAKGVVCVCVPMASAAVLLQVPGDLLCLRRGTWIDCLVTRNLACCF